MKVSREGPSWTAAPREKMHKRPSFTRPVNYTLPNEIEREELIADTAPKHITPRRWQDASPNARAVIEHMRKCTPRGAAPPWRSAPSVAAVERLLQQGISRQDLLSHVEQCAWLVTQGCQQARWYYPQNVFGDVTMARWAAEAAQAGAEAADHAGRVQSAEQRSVALEQQQEAARVENRRAAARAPASLDVARFAASIKNALGAPESESRAQVEQDAESSAARSDASLQVSRRNSGDVLPLPIRFSTRERGEIASG